jgi:HPt (histidine-containing phosphotransfer) domain-containing protein
VELNGLVKETMDSLPQSDLNTALNQLWVRFMPVILERVSALESAAAAAAAHKLTQEQQETAHAAAHNLAGTLGTFNLNRGTVLARELELLYALAGRPDKQLAARLTSVTAELRTLIESRSVS